MSNVRNLRFETLLITYTSTRMTISLGDEAPWMYLWQREDATLQPLQINYACKKKKKKLQCFVQRTVPGPPSDVVQVDLVRRFPRCSWKRKIIIHTRDWTSPIHSKWHQTSGGKSTGAAVKTYLGSNVWHPSHSRMLATAAMDPPGCSP